MLFRSLMINVLNGTLDFGIGEIQELRAQLEAGKVRLLGVVGEARLPEFPGVATAREQGLDVVVTKFRGLAGPKGMPDELAAQWEQAIRAALATDAYRAEYAKESLIPAVMGRAEARAFTTKFAGEVAATLQGIGIEPLMASATAPVRSFLVMVCKGAPPLALRTKTAIRSISCL